ncbi:hypothetical protein [Actinomadura roseirufa]|uniref:hypothetical protein n=1 Tax=Actinomadura roseirufa TaxID=2094049 RepID=UPI00104175AB|nr:hypothetical protein [Actinomadura roseirufa]
MSEDNEADKTGVEEYPDDIEHSEAFGRLGALMSRLHAYGLETDLQPRGLIVVNARAAGCCAEVPHPADTVTCRAREEDGGRLWLFHSWGEPIAEADRIVDAALVVATTLGAPMGHGCGGE